MLKVHDDFIEYDALLQNKLPAVRRVVQMILNLNIYGKILHDAVILIQRRNCKRLTGIILLHNEYLYL